MGFVCFPLANGVEFEFLCRVVFGTREILEHRSCDARHLITRMLSRPSTFSNKVLTAVYEKSRGCRATNRFSQWSVPRRLARLI